jgi:hypothetical protein
MVAVWRKPVTIISPAARSTDPGTSRRAAKINQRYRNTQRTKMLIAHALLAQGDPSYDGLTADECAIVCNFRVPVNGGISKSCYWKRHSELWRDFGYLRPRFNPDGSDVERKIGIGDDGRVFIITWEGIQHAMEVLAQFPDESPTVARPPRHGH